MNQDFKNCLDKKMLYRSDNAKALATKELKSAISNAEGFLKEVKRILEEKVKKYG